MPRAWHQVYSRVLPGCLQSGARSEKRMQTYNNPAGQNIVDLTFSSPIASFRAWHTEFSRNCKLVAGCGSEGAPERSFALPSSWSRLSRLTPIKPQSRFGDKVLEI